MKGKTMLKRSYSLLFCMLFLATAQISCAATNTAQEVGPLSLRKLRVKFQTDKKEYLVAEPIFLTLWLENTGNSTEYHHRKDLWDFALLDEQGRRLEFKGAIFEPELFRPYPESDFAPSAGFTALLPGKATRKGALDLLDYYGDGDRHGLDFYLRAGSYTILALRLPSDSVRIQIVEPTSPEDKSAMQQLVDEADNFFSSRFGTAELQFRFFADFVDKYPNSVYTPRAIARILFMTSVDTTIYDYAKNQYYLRYLVTHFPESGFADIGVRHLDPSAVPVAERRGLMDGLRRFKNHPGSPDLGKRVDELIGKLKK
jgi:hypothetical protein